MKNTRKTKKTNIAVKILAGVVLLALIIGAVYIIAQRNGSHCESEVAPTATPAEATAQTGTESAATPTETPAEETEVTADMTALDGYDLGNGLIIQGVNRYAGQFVEDGSDEIVADIFAITLENTGDTMVQYASIGVSAQGNSYSFNVTSLPAGGTVQVLETGKREIPTDLTGAAAELTAYAEFTEEPSMHEDALQLDATDLTIKVTNVSGEDITGDIYVYYKTVANDMYMGGITYRAKIEGGLAAGASAECYAGHYTQKYSEILFVTYVK